MKLKSIQNLTILDDLKPLRGYKPLTTMKVSTLNIPSEMELLLLSSNLLYQSKMILDGTSKRTGNLSAQSCTYKAIQMMKIIKDYQYKHIDYKELKSIKKEFKLNSLYK